MKPLPPALGPAPKPQASWDARAAANFVCGGMGAGLVVASAISGARDAALAWPMLVGLALVAAGLLSVFAEIGRPLRAVNVLANPRTSWMAREAWVAPILFAAGLGAVWTDPRLAWPAAALALVFVYCQGRMIQAARGIPAWRVPMIPPLFVVTGLAEGTGLWLGVAAITGVGPSWVLPCFSLAVIARAVLFHLYRRRVGAPLAPQAGAALDRAGHALLWPGTVVPLAFVAIAAAVPAMAWLLPLAGVLAAASGAWFKATLVLGAGYTQGFRLVHLPVRGARG